MVGLETGVGIPSSGAATAVLDLDEADAAFDESTGSKELGAELAAMGQVHAVERAGLGRLAGEVDDVGHRGLHPVGEFVGGDACGNGGIAGVFDPAEFVEASDQAEAGALFVGREGAFRAAEVEGIGRINAERGIDELTTATCNQVYGAGRLRHLAAEWSAADFGLPEAPFADLQGGDLAANLGLTEAILAGRAPAGLVDTIALNAAVALWICGRTHEVKSGIAQARDLLLGGAVQAKIAATREFYAA